MKNPNKTVPSYLSPSRNFHMLSLVDLLEARDLYHLHLMDKENVIATAIGRYRIRRTDPWPPEIPDEKSKKTERTLENSEVRDYSWPCILVFVDRWVPAEQIGYEEGELAPDNAIPKALHMPDGKVVPLCVLKANRDESTRPPVDFGDLTFPQNLIGGGYPVLTEVQEKERFASIGCLVTDGHLTYAITNRHVSGAAGEKVYSLIGGKKEEIGTTSEKQLTRLPFQKVYSEWPGKNVYVNLDAGLIKIKDENIWTAQLYGIGLIGKLADLSMNNLSVRLIGCPVRAFGCASGQIFGEIHALFYRYKTLGGFEYVSDFLIGPRQDTAFSTRPGDSGTVWLLETGDSKRGLMPLAVQWGGHVFLDQSGKSQYSYALATCLSTICTHLEVDLIRDWNIGLVEYWGAVGHYAIGNRACDVVSNPNLRQLMQANRTKISFETEKITKQDLQGLSNDRFVPLADVADLVWKIGNHKRGKENPNHFADMDKKNSNGETLLDICKDSNNVRVDVWQQYYDDVNDKSRGLLPFRVWQIYNEMVDAVQQGDGNRFVCAAGILAHYMGDACQPLHISHLFDGDPNDLVENEEGKKVPRAAGVHTGYETHMLNFNVIEMFVGVDETLQQLGNLTTIQGGRKAAIATVKLMRRTFDTLTPQQIIEEYLAVKHLTPKPMGKALWAKFGSRTVRVIAEGCRTLAMLWDSAWKEGDGDQTIGALGAVDEDALITLYQNKNFLRSVTLNDIAPLLTH